MSKDAILEVNTSQDVLRLYRDHLRYEYVRRLNVPQFQSIFIRALKGERFDDIIDACIAGCTPGCREDDHPGCAYCMSPSKTQRLPPHE